jgi:hypothetical protein
MQAMQKFYRTLLTDPQLLGSEFSYAEAERFMENLRALAAKKNAGGELTDLELEMVAGGLDTNMFPDFLKQLAHMHRPLVLDL